MVGNSLNELLSELTLTPEEFGESIGVTKGAVYKLLQGRTKKLTTSMAKKISDKYPNYSVPFLLSWNNKDTSVHNYQINNSIKLDKGLLNRKEELHSLAFYLNDHVEELCKDKVFKMFIDRIKSEARSELRIQTANEQDRKTEEVKSEIRETLKNNNK